MGFALVPIEGGYIAPILSKEFLDIQTIAECKFILNAYVTW